MACMEGEHHMDTKDRQELSGSGVKHHDLALEGFWKWAYKNILTNVTRGIFAEYLVVCALELESSPRRVWEEDFDICYKKIKIEVKCSAYVQDWHQDNESSTPQFNIKNRKCDVYVFCLHAEEDKEKVNTLNLSQWKFCVVGVDTIKKKLDEDKEEPQKTIRKRPIEDKLGGIWIEYGELKAAIEKYA